MDIRPTTADDADACVEVVRRLPDHFTDDTHDEVREAVAHQLGLVALDDGEVIAFVLAEQRYPRAAELTWIGVIPARRDQGVGTALLARLFDELAATDIALVEVRTLDASANYEPYVATRAFYERRGFVQVHAVDPYPGWNPGNPCAIYVAALAATARDGTG